MNEQPPQNVPQILRRQFAAIEVPGKTGYKMSERNRKYLRKLHDRVAQYGKRRR